MSSVGSSAACSRSSEPPKAPSRPFSGHPAVSAPEVQAKTISALLGQIDQTESEGIEFPTEDPLPIPHQLRSPVTLEDLRRVLVDRFGSLPRWAPQPVTFDPFRVSRDPEGWTALGTYGHPRLGTHPCSPRRPASPRYQQPGPRLQPRRPRRDHPSRSLTAGTASRPSLTSTNLGLPLRAASSIRRFNSLLRRALGGPAGP